jgi:hypothetical protein
VSVPQTSNEARPALAVQFFDLHTMESSGSAIKIPCPGRPFRVMTTYAASIETVIVALVLWRDNHQRWITAFGVHVDSRGAGGHRR